MGHLIGYVSTRDTEAPITHVHQMALILEDWAHSHGVALAAVYHDVCTGSSNPEPGWQALVSHCRTGQVSHVLILSRRWVSWPASRYRYLARHHVQVITVW